MKRREFLRNTSLAGLALPVLVINSCKNKTGSDPANTPVETKSASFALDEITVDALQEKMKNGEYTSRSITELYLKRIEEFDQKGPALNSVIEINADALILADQMDQERKNGKLRGALHGIPILIKDNINTADKMMTTAGSLALDGNYAKQDAFIVKQLREAGAVLLGKTNLSEWANFRSTRSSSGWSSRGGQTKNPYILDRNPCGSSSGSGAAVSANLCAIAIGTETNGSIGCPSSINGVVGIKPTVGLVSRSGIIPISKTQDTAGPMARTLRDAAILLGVMTGVDSEDAVTQGSKGKHLSDYTQFLDSEGLKGKIIGIEKTYLKIHESVDALLQKAIEQLKTKGATIVEIEFLDKIKIEGAEFDVLLYEFKDGLNLYLSKANAKVKSLKDLIAFNKQNENKVMPFFKQEILESAEEKGDLDSKPYKEALKKVLSVRKIIDDVMKSNKLDAICGPTNGPSWCTDHVNGDYFTGYGMYSPAAMAGYPHISIPMGLVQNLPVGLTFLAGAYQESALLSIAYSYEQISKNRMSPQFYSTLDEK